MSTTVEMLRLAEADAGVRPWRSWGPYVAPRAWGTVREPFHGYFHGDDGAGLGASHQTGWTGLVVDLLLRRPEGLR
jgi:hypothetical protein